VDETYIKVKGQWVYLYRAVDKQGRIVDFLLSKRRDECLSTRNRACPAMVRGSLSRMVAMCSSVAGQLSR